jgi:sugar/nucleoside kinase (ribokinase family)
LGKNDPAAFTRTLELRALVVTQGDKGVACYEQHQTIHVPAPPVDKIVDICGAGDSFSAGAVSALASGATLQESLAFGNLVASITITKRGTGTAHPEEVRAASRRHAILA